MTTIEWTKNADGTQGKTWNPVRGCTKVSPGCKNCYAETFSERFRGVAGHPYEQGFDLRIVPDKLADPLGWVKSRTVFVNSMSDLFHEDIPSGYIERVFRVMKLADWHTFQVLTKRAAGMREFMYGYYEYALPHIWLGVSVEDREYGLPRIEHLRMTNAAKRFLSIEPLLEDLGELDLSGIDWVIVGGESGGGARHMRPEWVRSIRDQCRAANIPFFFKQWGGVRKKKAGRLLDGKFHDAMPALNSQSAPSRTERLRLIAEVKQ